MEEVAVSDKDSDFFQTQNKAAVIGLSSCGEDLRGSLRIVLI